MTTERVLADWLKDYFSENVWELRLGPEHCAELALGPDEEVIWHLAKSTGNRVQVPTNKGRRFVFTVTQEPDDMSREEAERALHQYEPSGTTGTTDDHTSTVAAGTPRTCGHPGMIEDGRCDKGHGYLGLCGASCMTVAGPGVCARAKAHEGPHAG